jgi:hypothetical protein
LRHWTTAREGNDDFIQTGNLFRLMNAAFGSRLDHGPWGWLVPKTAPQRKHSKEPT